MVLTPRRYGLVWLFLMVLVGSLVFVTSPAFAHKGDKHGTTASHSVANC